MKFDLGAERIYHEKGSNESRGRENMAIKTKILFVPSLLSCLLFMSMTNQNPRWKGTIEEEGGIRVIKNPKEPLYGEIVFDLEEDLSIGNEEDENYMFYRVRGVAVDEQDNIYVSDMSNCRIQKFDKNGRYIMTIGRQGQGPGEFEQPTNVLVNDKSGNLFVKNRRRIEIFDRNGNYVNGILPVNYPYDIYIDAEDNIYGKLSSMTEEGDFREFGKVGLNGEIEETYARYPFYFIHQSRTGEMMTVGYTGYEPDLFISNIDMDSFVYGFSMKYEFTAVDTQGNLLFKMAKDAEEREFPAKEKRQLTKSRIFYKLPPYMPFFYSVFSDSQGRIYIRTNRRGREPVEMEIDLFNKDGYFLYKTKLPAYTYVIKNGFLYAYVVDEEAAMEYVKRYKIKNWDQIKER